MMIYDEPFKEIKSILKVRAWLSGIHTLAFLVFQ
jgi:hypothetical protein